MTDLGPVRIFCSAIGSLGDVHPALAVALAAREIGAELTLGVAAQYVDKVRSQGVAAVPVTDKLDSVLRAKGWTQEAFMQRCRLDPGLPLREVILPSLLRSCRAIDAALGNHEIITGTPLALSAPIVAESRQLPFVPFLLQPPRAPFAGPVKTRIERAMSRQRLAPAIDRVRAVGGLGPSRACPPFEFDGDIPFRIGLFPKLFASLPEAGQPRLDIVGSWRYDAEDGGSSGMPEDLEAFLQTGPPPVLATLGTAVDAEGRAFFGACLAAARATGRRSVLVTGRGWDGPDRGEDFIAVRYAPYRQVFPRCEAIVHHGGMGTLTFAIEAARPQVIVPVAFDQPQNAEIARRKGLACVVPLAQFNPALATRALGEVLQAGVTPQLRLAALGISQENGAEIAARKLVDLAHERRRVRSAAWRFLA